MYIVNCCACFCSDCPARPEPVQNAATMTSHGPTTEASTVVWRGQDGQAGQIENWADPHAVLGLYCFRSCQKDVHNSWFDSEYYIPSQLSRQYCVGQYIVARAPKSRNLLIADYRVQSTSGKEKAPVTDSLKAQTCQELRKLGSPSSLTHCNCFEHMVKVPSCDKYP